MKLALGTVQFGLDYGISNLHGQVRSQDIKSILNLAASVGINTLDTASAYGESEHALGKTKLTQQFNIVSKIPELKEKENKDKINEYLNTSLTQLNIKQLDGVLFHQVDNLINSSSAAVRFSALATQKALGKIKKIGVSVYTPEQLDFCCKNFTLDLVQLPLNILDQRFIKTGWLSKLADLNIEVHTRSAFLQGLLLMNPNYLDAYFSPYIKQIKRFTECAKHYNVSPLTLALALGCQQRSVNKIIVGCCNVKQLQEIISAYDVAINFSEDLSHLACSDERLLLPNRWQLSKK